MLTPKNRQNSLNRLCLTKMALIMLVFGLLLFNDSIFAAARKNNRSNNNQTRQQTTRSAPARRSTPARSSAPSISRNTIRQQNRAAARSNVTRSAPRSSQLSNRNNLRRNSSTSITRQNRTPIVRQPNRTTTNRRSVSPPAAKSNTIKSPTRSPATIKSPNTEPARINTNRNQNSALTNRNPLNNQNNLSTNRNNRLNQRRTLSNNVIDSSALGQIQNRITSRSSESRQNTARINNRESLSANRRIGRQIGEAKQPSAAQSQTPNVANRRNLRSSGLRESNSIAGLIRNRKSSGDTDSNTSTARERSITQRQTRVENSNTIAGSIRNRKSPDEANTDNSATREIKRQTRLDNRNSIASLIRSRRNNKTSTKDTDTSRNSLPEADKTKSVRNILRQSDNANLQERNNRNDRAALRNSNRESKADTRTNNTNARERRNASREPVTRVRKNSIRDLIKRNPDNSRQSKNDIENRSSGAADRRAKITDRTERSRSQKILRDREARHVYDDRPNLIRHSNKNVYAFRDRRHRTHYRVVRPANRYLLCYDWGWHRSYRYFYPYYHRKYIFVSLGGYWPFDYSCMRYYWYGYHPYYWYGYYPIAREVEGDTYNYYTYNYYGYDNTTSDQSGLPVDYGLTPVDENTFADVREKLAQQQGEVPAEPTAADLYFESGVKAFESGDFNLAARKFEEAMKLAPDDMILPFAYSQTLMANEQYSQAASVLREALAKVTPEKEGVFYPRGLYANDEKLAEHINRLSEKAQLNSDNADLQLLLGYHLLGTDMADEAFMPLWNASQDPVNAKAATVLLELRDTIINSEDTGDEIEEPEKSNETDNIVDTENTYDTNTELISTSDEVINKAGSIRLKETVFMAALLTLITGSGIYHYIRC